MMPPGYFVNMSWSYVLSLSCSMARRLRPPTPTERVKPAVDRILKAAVDAGPDRVWMRGVWKYRPTSMALRSSRPPCLLMVARTTSPCCWFSLTNCIVATAGDVSSIKTQPSGGFPLITFSVRSNPTGTQLLYHETKERQHWYTTE